MKSLILDSISKRQTDFLLGEVPNILRKVQKRSDFFFQPISDNFVFMINVTGAVANILKFDVEKL